MHTPCKQQNDHFTQKDKLLFASNLFTNKLSSPTYKHESFINVPTCIKYHTCTRNDDPSP